MVKKNMLNRKLRRDLWQNRMQIVAMVLLCALGTWVFSGLDAAWRMIDLSASTYFEQQNLADLWITLQGVDRNIVRQIQNIDGVQDVQARATAELETTLPDEPSLMVTAYDGAIRINGDLVARKLDIPAFSLHTPKTWQIQIPLIVQRERTVTRVNHAVCRFHLKEAITDDASIQRAYRR